MADLDVLAAPSWTSFLYSKLLHDLLAIHLTNAAIVIMGSLSVDRSTVFPERTAVVLSSGVGEDHVALHAEEDNTEIILVCTMETFNLISKFLHICAQLAAEPLHQPVARFGPFVMNTKEELQKALLDCEPRSFYMSTGVESTTHFKIGWKSTASRMQDDGSRPSEGGRGNSFHTLGIRIYKYLFVYTRAPVRLTTANMNPS